MDDIQETKNILVLIFAIFLTYGLDVRATQALSPFDYQAWYKKRRAYEKMHDTLRELIASVEDEEELLPDSKKTIRRAVDALESTVQGLLGAPSKQEVYAALFDGAVQRGNVSLMRFLVKECGVDPNTVATLEKPHVLHSLDVQKKYHLEGPYSVAKELFALGFKQNHVNSWDAQGQTPLHMVIQNMIIAGANSAITQEQFAAGMAQQDITFESASEMAQEYEGFLALNRQRGEEWAAVAQLLIARGARNIKNAQGKKVEDLLKESNCKATFCKKFADYLGQK